MRPLKSLCAINDYVSMNVVCADLSNEAHAAALLALLDMYARDPMGGGHELSDYTKAHLVQRLSERPECRVFLAFDEEQPAGLAITFEVFSTFACRPILNVHDFSVAPEIRGRGVAKQLLTSVENSARELGCCKMTLEILEGNHRAQKVYRDFGFEGYELDPEMGKAMFLQKVLDEEGN